MARRRNDNLGTFALLIAIIAAVPMLVVTTIRWLVNATCRIYAKINNSKTQKILDSESIDLAKIDQMDGLTFEYYISELLKKNGYNKVLVTKSNGDFGVDITAYRDRQKYAFQCKNYQSNLGVSPIQEVYSGAPKYNATVCVVVTNSYFTPHARELAKSLGVVLWDRIELAKLIQSSNPPYTKKCRTEIPKSNTSICIPQNSISPQCQEIKPTTVTQTSKIEQKSETDIISTVHNESNNTKQEVFSMATTLGAGKYIFGVDIPEGKYNLKAISGCGGLNIQKLIDGTWEEEYISFGVEQFNAKTYHGLSLPRNKYFEVSGNVIFEITKATMIEIE